MNWIGNLNDENFFAIYDVALDIQADVQLKQSPTLALVPSIVRFEILMPADNIPMRDRYGDLRLKAIKFLESEGIIRKVELRQHGHRWKARAEVTVAPEAFDIAFPQLEAEARKRAGAPITPPPSSNRDPQPQSSAQTTGIHVPAPDFEKVSITWLINHVPLKVWLGFVGLVLAAFLGGIKVGQLTFIRELLGDKAVTFQTPQEGDSYPPGIIPKKYLEKLKWDVRNDPEACGMLPIMQPLVRGTGAATNELNFVLRDACKDYYPKRGGAPKPLGTPTGVKVYQLEKPH